LLSTPMLQEDIKLLTRKLFPSSCAPSNGQTNTAEFMSRTDRLLSRIGTVAPAESIRVLVDEWFDSLRAHADQRTVDPAVIERLCSFISGELLCLFATHTDQSQIWIDAISEKLATCKASLPELAVIYTHLQSPAEPMTARDFTQGNPSPDLPEKTLGLHLYAALRKSLPTNTLHVLRTRPELEGGRRILPRALLLAVFLDTPPENLAGLIRDALLCRDTKERCHEARAGIIANFGRLGALVVECLVEIAPGLDEWEDRELADFLHFIVAVLPNDPTLIGQLYRMLSNLCEKDPLGMRRDLISLLLILHARGLSPDWATPAMSALRTRLCCPELDEALK